MRSGPCSPWISGQTIQSEPSIQAAITKNAGGKAGPILTTDQVNAICAEAAGAGTQILYDLSGRIFTGPCGPVTIRPVARPVNVDTRGFSGANSWGYGSAGSAMAWFNLGAGGVTSHFGDSTPSEIPFQDYPVTSIVEVKIDGVVIPPIEYELRDGRTLVRIRPTASYTPTERWGWPTAQIPDTPDTEIGTFSITYTYGQDPGDGGRLAARRLAEVLALPSFGDTSRLPQRLTSFSRQGVSGMAIDVMDVLKSGSLGIWEVDAWILSVNPGKATRQSLVWSPDIVRGRRQGRTTQQ